MTRKSVVQFLFLLFLLPVISFSQKVNLSLSQSGNSTIELQKGNLSVQPYSLKLSNNKELSYDLWAINPSRTHLVTYLHGTDQATIHLYDISGNELSQFKVNAFDKTDESLAIFLTNQLLVGIRHTIGTFEFYNWDGHFINTLSNTAGSTEGEKISEFGINPNSYALIATNPMIQMQGNKNSAAAELNPFSNQKTSLAYETKASPVGFSYSNDGKWSVLVSSKSGGKTSLVKVIDELGSTKFELEADVESAIGATLDESKSFITVYSDSRMQVYQLSNEERLGSSSVRGIPLVAAFYDAKDQLLIGVQGNSSENEISGLSVQAVHLGKRKIAKDESTLSSKIISGHKLQLKRIKSGNYTISGLGSTLKITAAF
ncbi:hypothetical protein EP331_04250 [bacterium]|nr:MAG: hypothetical protein EP331_04250 [bacterium]